MLEQLGWGLMHRDFKHVEGKEVREAANTTQIQGLSHCHKAAVCAVPGLFRCRNALTRLGRWMTQELCSCMNHIGQNRCASSLSDAQALCFTAPMGSTYSQAGLNEE